MNFIGKVDIKYSNIFTSLTNCYEFFSLKLSGNNFHNGLFDSFMNQEYI